jgi:hypothetical protein
MISTPEDIIVMLLSVIVNNVDSLKTLNILMRTSKSLRLAASDPRFIPNVISRMPSSSKEVLHKLFVLSEKVSLPFVMLPSLYNHTRLTRQCSVMEAFRVAVIVHEGVRGIASAFHRRHRRSLAMKLVWKNKKKEAYCKWQERRRDVEQIHQDLFIIPSSDHVITDAAMFYMALGEVGPLSPVYRDQRKNAQLQMSKRSLSFQG